MATIRAHFDGRVFVPEEPVDLARGTAVTVEVRDGTGLGDEPAADQAMVVRRAKRRQLVGSKPGLITYMAPDFDAPLEEFRDYM